MKKIACLMAVMSLLLTHGAQARRVKMPYQAAGLTAEQAAAHLLGRFSFGARPGEVSAVARQGLERWFEEQLKTRAEEPTLERRLAELGPLQLSDSQICETYLQANQIRKMAAQAGAVSSKKPPKGDKADYQDKIAQFENQRGYRDVKDLLQALYAQKLLRAVYSHSQVREVLTDFWFNHFNVSRTEKKARPHLLAYERDAIRANVFGNFRTMLGATAKHPAMLYYLNNAESVAPDGAPRLNSQHQRRPPKKSKKKGAKGLNENYARELMELHTLGVGGGYNQHDVEQVARALTGWTTYGSGPQVEKFKARMGKNVARTGVIHQGSFYFVPSLHDAGAKQILGQKFAAGHGLDEGERVLDLLAKNSATAKFIARKLAVRFVGDHPDEKLVNRLAQRFVQTGGNLEEEYDTLVESPEFWAPAARRAKVKTAFEFVVSSIRALDGQLQDERKESFARSLPTWMEHMGQPIYGYQPPTGFPDRAEMWVNSGNLVTRINFAFALVTNRLPGVRIDTQAHVHEKIEAIAADLLPGRDSHETTELVKSILVKPEFFKQIGDSSSELAQEKGGGGKSKSKPLPRRRMRGDFSDSEKVVGILISSPEFQRR